MAPPCILPSLVLTLYLIAINDSAYLVAMPKTPVSQHHNTAPGPPKAIAVPTPTIFPVPMVAASDVAKAAKAETSPSASLSFVTDNFIPFVNVGIWINFSLTVKYRCVPKSSTIMPHPHTYPSTVWMNWLILSNIFEPPKIFQ